VKGGPQAQRRRGFIMAFGAGAVAALGVAALIAAITGDLGSSDLTSEASQVIRDDYFKPVQSSELDNASVDGIVRELRKRYDDRFSHYLDPHQLQEFESATSGRFSGVGLTVTGVGRGLRVASVLPRTPAQRARIKEGDLITAVDGRSLAGVPANVATARIKGPPGTPVELRVVSGSGGGARNVKLKRASVAVPVAVGEIKRAGTSKVAYVRYATFSEGAHGELAATIERLDRQGAQGLVLDLRGNGGGLLNEGVLIASTFVEDGLVVSTKGRSRPEVKYDAKGDAIDKKLPVVVLVDGGSASASEIVTGALRDRKRATVVGTKTFGKGVFQEVENLPNGGSLDLTVGSYYLPSGENIGGKGILPQVKAKDNPKTRRDEALPIAVNTVIDKLSNR
jgi:carboxyl-terminal processing protease